MELSGELPEGTPIKEFLKFAGTIPLEDLEEMKQAMRKIVNKSMPQSG